MSSLIDQIIGRARFCRDRGEVKTPGLLEESAAAITKMEAERDGLLAALDAVLPSKLCGEGWNLPGAETVQIVVTFGELKAARAAIAKATGAA